MGTVERNTFIVWSCLVHAGIKAEASMIRLITVTLTLLLTVPTVALAQEVTPEDVLPPVTALQGDWTLQATSVAPRDPLAIAQLYSGIYLGPTGNRATVLVARAQEGPLA